MMAVAIGCAATGESSSAQIPCSYEVAAVIQGPPGPNHESPTFATAISPDGQHVVGYYRPDAVGDPRPWYWSQATGLILLPLPPGFTEASPADINNSRVIVGTGVWPAGLGFRGYMYDMASGAFTVFEPLPGGVWSFANGINEAGTVCGTRSIGSKTDPVNPQTAFIWTQKDGFTDLGVMNGPHSYATGIAKDGTVVGYTGSTAATANTRAFVWCDGETHILPAAPDCSNSVARATAGKNAQALTAIKNINGTLISKGFLYSDSTFTNLGVLPSYLRTFPRSIDSFGQVIGTCSDVNVQYTGFVWRNGEMRSLSSLMPPSNYHMEQPHNAATNGMIVGEGDDGFNNVIGLVLHARMPKPGDTNCDNERDVADLLNVIAWWGPCMGCSTDVNGDFEVNIFDLLEVIDNWD